MKISIDSDANTVHVDDAGEVTILDLYSPEAFSVVSRLWVTQGWGLRYTYGFTWMGRPIIQLPEDMVTIQEVIYRVKPDIVVETGVAHGGSLIFYAGLLEAMGNGHVIGVDIDIREHNRAAIESHELSGRISLVQGSSVENSTLEQVRSLIPDGSKVLVLLDSNHTKKHVLAELDAYSGLVSVGSYIVATDGVMEWLDGVPGAGDGWVEDNPKAAVEQWLRSHPEFVLEDPPLIAFNEGQVTERITHWPSAYLRRLP